MSVCLSVCRRVDQFQTQFTEALVTRFTGELTETVQLNTLSLAVKTATQTTVFTCTRSRSRLTNALLTDEGSALDSHAIACNFAKYSPISKKMFSLADSAINLS